MRVGIDCDGVLADFNRSFMELLVRQTGRNLFPAGYEPHVWNYPREVGYTSQEVSAAWERVKQGGFWLELHPYDDWRQSFEAIHRLYWDHDCDIYFVTSRVGASAKYETESWLRYYWGQAVHLPSPTVTVLISAQKGLVAKALELDAYIDDKLENVVDVVLDTREHEDEVPRTRPFLLTRRWNAEASTPAMTRVATVAAFVEILVGPYSREDQLAVERMDHDRG